MFLVGDIGGTNARFAIARTTEQGGIVISDFEKFKADEVGSFEDGVNQFLDKLGYRPSLALLAVAGPIENDEVQFTNRNWKIRRENIIENCNLHDVCLLNDFTAMAHAVPKVCDDSYIPIRTGIAHKNAPILVAGPGTGFGASLLLPHEGRWLSIASEGGHSLYTPRNELQREIVRVLEPIFGSVSIEHIAGGHNFNALAQAVADIHGVCFQKQQPQEVIEKALIGDPYCIDICVTRAHAILSGLGNMALIGGARGGAVLAGGVARHLINFVIRQDALEAFDSIWPDSNYLRDIPIKLLADPMAPLIGAVAHYMQGLKKHDTA